MTCNNQVTKSIQDAVLSFPFLTSFPETNPFLTNAIGAETDVLNSPIHTFRRSPNLLSRFRSTRFVNSKPHYESLRLAIFQGFLLSLKHIQNGTVPRRDQSCGFNPENQNATRSWSILSNYLLSNRSVLVLAEDPWPRFQTRNYSKKYSPFYILKVLKYPNVREAFHLFTEVFFSDCSEKRMEKLFRVKAIGEDWEREDAWEKVRRTLIEELVGQRDETAERQE